jgi:MerR family transcriptional regulator/heat shock protein HspR
VMDGFEFSEEAHSDAKVLIISVAARMAGMHPQTLRQYDRLGLLQAGRAAGGGRRYSARDVSLLREIQRLSQEEGISLAGIRRIIDLENLAMELRERVGELEVALVDAEQRLAQMQALTYPRRDLIPARTAQTALVVWKPRRPS